MCCFVHCLGTYWLSLHCQQCHHICQEFWSASLLKLWSEMQMNIRITVRFKLLWSFNQNWKRFLSITLNNVFGLSSTKTFSLKQAKKPRSAVNFIQTAVTTGFIHNLSVWHGWILISSRQCWPWKVRSVHLFWGILSRVMGKTWLWYTLREAPKEASGCSEAVGLKPACTHTSEMYSLIHTIIDLNVYVGTSSKCILHFNRFMRATECSC